MSHTTVSGITVTLPADVNEIIKQLKATTNKPSRGEIIAEAVRGVYGNHPSQRRKPHRHAP